MPISLLSNHAATLPVSGLDRVATGIAGFDLIADGGLPKNRTTLVVGSAGSAKTVFAMQFLLGGILGLNEAGVFVSFEEPIADIRTNFRAMGWDMEALEQGGRLAFVDASPQPAETIIGGDYDLSALLARIEFAVRKVQAKRVSLDSLGAVFAQLPDAALLRRELFRIGAALKSMGVTSVMTAERTEDSSSISRHDVEEFVADNVVILRNFLEQEKRRRTVEVLKFRGASHQKGQFPFTVVPGHGIVAVPLSALKLEQRSSVERVTSGIPELDKMCGGGLFRNSVVLLTGATGCGKTLMATHFIRGGNTEGDRTLFLAFEESREQLSRNAEGWGVDFAAMERRDMLRIECAYPERHGLEDHLISIKKMIETYRPTRMVVDSLSALERVGTRNSYREFVVGLTAFVKQHEVLALVTAITPALLGGTSVTEAHISTVTDTIIMLRYVESAGIMRRGMTVLKMRGSLHDKHIREFTIDGSGMHIGEPFHRIAGIISGQIEHLDHHPPVKAFEQSAGAD